MTITPLTHKHYNFFSTVLTIVILSLLVFNAFNTAYDNRSEYVDTTKYLKDHRALHCETGFYQIWDTSVTPIEKYNIADSEGKALRCLKISNPD